MEKNPSPPLNSSEADSLEDSQIIQRCLSGEPALFRILVQRHEKMVFSFIWRRCRSTEQAEDLTQEAFLRAYRSLDTFRGQSSFKTWLTRIALNLTLSHFKSRAFKEGQQTDFEYPTGLSIDGESQAAYRLEVARLFRYVDELSEDLREVVSLCVIESYSYTEAASILEIPSGTVASRMHRALKMLRGKMLGEKPPAGN